VCWGSQTGPSHGGGLLSATFLRCLQIFRHLHVLASESRCVEAEEVTSRVDVHLPMKLTPKSGNPANGESICLQTPCLAPPISTVSSQIRVN